MYGKRYQKFILLLTSGLIAIPQTVASADVKKVGRTTATTTVNTILSGKGVPAASIGINGDFYIDKVNLNFYGPKANGLWPLPVSMRGPAGAAGNDGKNGVDGKAGTTTVAAGGSSAPGPAGPAGPAGAKGDQGDAGPAGPAGTQGSIGLTGSTGPAGPQGPQGIQGPQGQKGDTGDSGSTGPAGPQGPSGPQGFTGDSGLQGLQGVQGPQGPQGIAGVANNPIKIMDLKFSGANSTTIALDALASSGTDAFGALPGGYGYRFTIVLHMRTNTSIMSLSQGFSSYLSSDIGTPNYLTSIGYGRFYDNSTADNRYQMSFIMVGVISVPSGAPANFNAYFKDVSGFTKTASNCTLSGKAMFEQVSSIS